MEKATQQKLKDDTKRFPRKVTNGVSKKTGRAKRRRKPHAAKMG